VWHEGSENKGPSSVTNIGNRRRICIVVSDFMTVQVILQGQIRALSETYEVTVTANTDDKDSERRLNLNSELIPVSAATL